MPALKPRAKTIVELADKAQDYSAVLEYCQGRNDMLGYAAALVAGAK